MVQLHCAEEQANFTVAAYCSLGDNYVLLCRSELRIGNGELQLPQDKQLDCNGQYFEVDANINSQVGALKWGALELYHESSELPGALQSH